MYRTLFVFLLLMMGVSLSAESGRNWRDFNAQENIIPENYILQPDTVLVATKIISNVDMKEYVLTNKFTNESAYERKSLNSLVCLLLDLTGSSKGAEVKTLYSSWDEYYIMEIPVGDYKLHSMMYPPSANQNKMLSFELSDMLDYHFSADSPCVYIGDINLQFNVENEFGILENRLEIVDNFDEAQQFLNGRIMDENGSDMVFEKSLPSVLKRPVFEIQELR